MLRTLRAFAWMRWRVLMNSLERRGSRDVMERFSAAFEQVAPILGLIVLVPSMLALGTAGVYAGWRLGREAPPAWLVQGLRYVLLAAVGLCIAGPLILPAAERTSAVRLLLLPIRRGLLYAGQCMSALADPWILFAGAVLTGIPAGMAAAGAVGGAAIAALAGLFTIVALVGLTLLVTLVIHILVRDRRRGELIALLVIVGLPMIGMLPGLLEGQRQHRGRDAPVERQQGEQPAWLRALERGVLALSPSELYTNVARRAASAPGESGGPLAGLVMAAVLLNAGGLVLFTHILGAPASTGSRRTTSRGAQAFWRIPGVSSGTSAVAMNQLRLALRTPRGRSILLSPIAVFVMFAAVMWRSGSGMDFGPIRLRSGIGLAGFASVISLLSILPLAANQFAIDRAGLTLTLLAPLETTALLRGKALGNALIIAIPSGLGIVGAALLFPSGDPAIWLSIPLTLIAMYLLIAPLAAILSAMFPRAVDLNSIGRGSNAHGAAGLLGTLGAVAAGAPCALLVLLASKILGQTSLAPVFLAVWIGICLGADLLLFRIAAAVFERRKENLAMVD
jgi:hypothetical protein